MSGSTARDGPDGTLTEVARLLDGERAQTLSRLSALTAEFDGIVAASMAANSDDEHDPEGATIAFERERVAALRAQAQAHLSELERARARAAGGAYGTCRSCRRAIAGDRLRALPATELCATCANVTRPPISGKAPRR